MIRDHFRTKVATQIAPRFKLPLADQRASLDELGTRALGGGGLNQQLPGGIALARSTLAGLTVEHLVPASRDRRVVLYVHGGGFVAGSCNSHRALVARLGVACRARVVLPEYRLAPEYRFPAGLDDLVATYEALLTSGTQPDQIIVAGDSSGAGLAVSMLVRARDQGLAMPRTLVLLSPWLDLSLAGESMRTRAHLDPWFDADVLSGLRDLYLGDVARTHPLASPLGADLRGLPPMLIQVGDHELLLSDSQRMHERATQAGVDSTLEVYPELWHVWHAFAPTLPEANAALAQIGEFVDAQFFSELRSYS
jgi:acetyl esterase/lipase